MSTDGINRGARRVFEKIGDGGSQIEDGTGTFDMQTAGEDIAHDGDTSFDDGL